VIDRASHAGARGSVTAETAVLLPALMLVLWMCVWAVDAAGTWLRCIEAAGEAVRSATAGGSPGAARSAAAGVAPPGATITVRQLGGRLLVRVHAVVRPIGPVGSRLPGLAVSSTATAVEPAR
jgi:hypothetical protein